MGPRAKSDNPLCQVCKAQPSKYRCSACPIRYCSVACYKQHKLTHESNDPQPPVAPEPQPLNPVVDSIAPSTQLPVDQSDAPHEQGKEDAVPPDQPLKRLSELLWPPEPDSSIFTDPLKKEDPKPLRREELLRIATSPQLRTLLSTTSLPSILTALDSLPSHIRHTSLSRLLGLDPVSLSAPGGTARSFISGRDSPPPLGELIGALTGQSTEESAEQERGWYLPSAPGGEKIWIGEEEKKIMRLFAGVVCHAIDGTDTTRTDEVGWGHGGLGWEV